MSIIIDGTGTISGVSATGLTTAQTVTQSAIATGVAGTGPAFSVYSNAAQTIASTTPTKVLFQVERFDTANAFDSTTNYRFQPLVAGYYSISATVATSRATNNEGIYLMLYKTGTCLATAATNASVNTYAIPSVTAIIYLNGSTDYVETYVGNYVNTSTAPTAPNIFGTGDGVCMTGSLVRAA